MQGISLPHIIILIFVSSLPALAFGRAIVRAGFSEKWKFIALIPIVNIVLLWIFAFSKWPAYPESRLAKKSSQPTR